MTPIEAIEADSRSERNDYIVVEEPLAIRIASSDPSLAVRDFAITMRTPGHDGELAAGLLFTEGLLQHRSELLRMEVPPQRNEIVVYLDDSRGIDLGRHHRNLTMSSSCGVCGKTSIESLQSLGCRRVAGELRLRRELIHELPAVTRRRQDAFEHTGALHAATLFDSRGELRSIREDVGRHNALDKLIGAEFLAGRSMEESVVLLSGRVSFELVQKCVMARVPVIAAVGAPSSLAVETARRYNVTLLGFVRDGRFNIYTGADRVV